MDQQRIIELLQKYEYQHLISKVTEKTKYILIGELKYVTIFFSLEKKNKWLLFHALGIEMTNRTIHPVVLEDSIFYNYDHLCLCVELGYDLGVFTRHPCALIILLKNMYIPTLKELHDEIIDNDQLQKSWDYLFRKESTYEIKQYNIPYIISQLTDKLLLLDNIGKGGIYIPKLNYVYKLCHYPHPLAASFKLKQVIINKLLGKININGYGRKTLGDHRSTGLFQAQLKMKIMELNIKRLLRLAGKRNTLILSEMIPTDLCRSIASYI